MTLAAPPDAHASVTIAAPADEVYALITDLPTMGELGSEVATLRWHRGDRAAPGAVFKGHNRNGARSWTTTCTVTDADPGRLFAFDVKSVVIPIAHWRYEIVAADGGCTVTESTWDRRPGWFRTPGGMATGVRDRTTANAEHIRQTLERLKARAEGDGIG